MGAFTARACYVQEIAAGSIHRKLLSTSCGDLHGHEREEKR